jgi:hypothetical protein
MYLKNKVFREVTPCLSQRFDGIALPSSSGINSSCSACADDEGCKIHDGLKSSTKCIYNFKTLFFKVTINLIKTKGVTNQHSVCWWRAERFKAVACLHILWYVPMQLKQYGIKQWYSHRYSIRNINVRVCTQKMSISRFFCVLTYLFTYLLHGPESFLRS